MPINIASLPYVFDMAASHAGGTAAGMQANADSQNLLNLTGGWNNGVYSRLIPPTVSELYCGYGNFFFPAGVSRFNVRCMIRAGAELYRTNGAKFIIANLSNSVSGDRAMAISAERDTGGGAPYDFSQWTHASRNVSSITNLPAGFPSPGEYHFASTATPKSAGNYQGEWVCYEFEAIVGQAVSVYIHTQDGVVARGQGSPFCSSDYAVPAGSTFVNFGLGWYWGPNQGSYPGLYLDIGDVIVSDQYIGPPAGFLTQEQQPMAFPSSTGTKNSLADVFVRTQKTAAQIKARVSELNTRAAAGNVSAWDFVQLSTYLADARAVFVAAQAVPGIGPFAQDQCNDPALNIGAEFTAMMTALDALRASINTQFPKDGSGYLLFVTLDANGRYVYRQLTPAQTATIRTNMTTFIGTID
jgi:hypothetical protein